MFDNVLLRTECFPPHPRNIHMLKANPSVTVFEGGNYGR